MTKEDLAKELQDLQQKYFTVCAALGDFTMNRDRFDSLISEKKKEALELQEKASKLAASSETGETARADSAA